tara:strand:+ start:338 stop:952 length:615 start_codon:yes stop_codon:yes gene_type:complete
LSKHAYTKSLKQNIKWFIKRTIKRKNTVDTSIKKYLNNIFNFGLVFEKGLNIGCGYYTPFDIDIKRLSPKLINADVTLLVKFFRPFSGKKLILTNENWKHHIQLINPDVIYCFHTFSFIQIDWVRLIKYFASKDIKFIFDWSIQSSVELSEGVNRFCIGKEAQDFFDILIENNFQILDLSKNYEQTNRDAITKGNRFIVSNINI